MDTDSKYILEEEVIRLANLLKTLDPKTDEYQKVSERLLKLHEADMDELKVNREFQKRSDDSTLKELELNFKKEEAKMNRRTDYIRIVVELLGIGLPMLAYNAWFHQGLNWEVDHTFTSNWMRNLLGKLKPTKR